MKLCVLVCVCVCVCVCVHIFENASQEGHGVMPCVDDVMVQEVQRFLDGRRTSNDIQVSLYQNYDAA